MSSSQAVGVDQLRLHAALAAKPGSEKGNPLCPVLRHHCMSKTDTALLIFLALFYLFGTGTSELGTGECS